MRIIVAGDVEGKIYVRDLFRRDQQDLSSATPMRCDVGVGTLRKGKHEQDTYRFEWQDDSHHRRGGIYWRGADTAHPFHL